MKSINIALIGFGKRGKTYYRLLKQMSNIDVVSICEKKPFKLAGSPPIHKDYRQILRDNRLHAVCICLPSNLHYPVAKDFLLNSKHVIVEKPFTFNSREAISLVKIANRKNLVCMAGYNLRHSLIMKRVKNLIDKGILGRVTMVRGRQSHNWGGKHPFRWSINKKTSGGGTIIDNATHYLDLFLYFFDDIVDISAVANNRGFGSVVEDNAIINLRFKNGIIGTIETSWSDPLGRTNELTVWGTKAVLEVAETNQGETFEIKHYKTLDGVWNSMSTQKFYVPKGIEQTKKRNFDNILALTEDGTRRMLMLFLKSVMNKEKRILLTKSYSPENIVTYTEKIYKSL